MMSMFRQLTADAEEARQQRLAELRKRRAKSVPYGEPEEVPVTDLRAGDFLVTVPTQDRVRGMRYDATVSEIKTVRKNEIVESCGPLAIVARTAGIVPICYRDGGALLGAAIWPSHFTAIVRRPAR